MKKKKTESLEDKLEKFRKKFDATDDEMDKACDEVQVRMNKLIKGITKFIDKYKEIDPQLNLGEIFCVFSRLLVSIALHVEMNEEDLLDMIKMQIIASKACPEEKYM